MTNQEHLFVETPQPNLSRGMKLLNGAYTQFFNVRRRRRGHLFQGRFKAHLVEDQGYWSELSRYVHLNPVRAGMTKDPLDDPWSSFPGSCRAFRRLDWVMCDRVLADHGPGDLALRRRRYAQSVRQGIERPLRAPWETAWHGLVPGTEAFLETVRQRLALAEADSEMGQEHSGQ